MKNKICRILSYGLCASLIMIIMSGCTFSKEPVQEEIITEIEEVVIPPLEIKQIKTSDTIELGEKYNFDLKKYFTISGEDTSEVKVDLKSVIIDKVGEYKIKISYLDEEYTVDLNVVDTTAPQLKIVENIVYSNCSEFEDKNALFDIFDIKAEDETETTIELVDLIKYADFSVLKDKTVEEVASEIQQSFSDGELFEGEKEEADFSKEQIFAGRVIASDEAGNEAEELIIVINDLTAPEIKNFADKTFYQDDLTKEPDYDLDSVVVKDNVDGEIDRELWTIDAGILDEGKHKYYVKISAEDKAGNVVEKQITLTVAKKQAYNGGNGGAGNGNAGNGGAGNGGAGNGGAGNGGGYVAPDPSGYAQQVLDLVNQERAAAGLGALTLNSTLCANANVRAGEIVGTFSHTRPDGSACSTAITVPYGYAGENIAAGQNSPSSVMNSWMNSEGHKANILNGNYTQIGIGYYYDPNSLYKHHWVQLFIG